MNARSIVSRLARAAGVAALVAAFMAGGFAAPSSAAVAPGDFEGLVLVAPAKKDARPVQSGPRIAGFNRARIVDFASAKPMGSILIDTRGNRLYYILGGGKAAMYRIASAKPGFEWAGTHRVSSKTKWPDWRPPAQMRKRKPELPVFMAGGPDNPLGARAIYLGSSIYRIHGTNEPSSIGKRASSGCIRMLNADVSELYSMVKIGASVTVM